MQKQRILDILLRLVKVKSETATLEEKSMAIAMYHEIAQMPYFIENDHFCNMTEIPGDYLEREVVWGLYLDENNPKTVVLINHYDTVDTHDYGSLREYSNSPRELMEHMVDLDLNEECTQDLKSGNWLFGRGTADMKGGAAMQLEYLERHSTEMHNGSILYIAVPDEETLSAGMRHAINILSDLKEDYDLDYKLLIDVETHVRKVKEKPVLYRGSIGKIMPTVYVRGVRAHVGNVYQGLNPIGIISDIVRAIELNQDLCDSYSGEKTPAPTWLYLRDNKKGYDVSLPESAYSYLNILTFSSSPQRLLEKIKEIVREEFAKSLKRYNNAYLAHYSKQPENTWTNEVYYFSELFTKLKEEQGNSFISAYDKYLESIIEQVSSDELDMPKATGMLSDFLVGRLKHLNPVVVIALAPPYYPHVILDYNKNLDDKVKNLEAHLKEYTRNNLKQELDVVHFYTGISDMSYASLADASEVIGSIEPNMPLWGDIYNIPLDLMSNLDIPSINLGPWGKDLHMMTERIYLPDLLENTPKLLAEAIDFILCKQ
jgi:arginine utilization protein RocB